MNTIKSQYQEYLNTLEGAKNYNAFKEILYGTPDTLVLELYKLLLPEIKNKKELSILDVGGGDGKRIIALKELFLKDGIEVEITLVEPSEAFIKTLEQQPENNIEVIHSRFEDFKSDKKYDLILLIHSIFTFEGTIYLEQIKKTLNNDGLLCIVSNAPTSFLAQLKSILDQDKGSRREINSVIKDLEENGFSYKTIAFNTIFGGCVENSNLTAKGELVLEWLGLRPINDLSEDILNQAKKCIIKNSKDGFISEQEVVVLARQN